MGDGSSANAIAAPLRFTSAAGVVTIELPELPEELLAQPAWVLKLSPLMRTTRPALLASPPTSARDSIPARSADGALSDMRMKRISNDHLTGLLVNERPILRQ